MINATSVILINSLLLGLAASFAPCLFPVLPTYVAFLSKEENSEARPLITSALVTLGIMTIFVIFGLLVSSVITFFSNNYLSFRTGQGIILIILGFLLIINRSINLNLFNKMNNSATQIIDSIQNPYVLAYSIGFLFSLLAAPCAIILFLTLFTTIATLPWPLVIISMSLFSIGAGLSFFIVAGVIPRLKDRVIENRNKLETIFTVASGMIIIVVGAYLTLDGQKLLNF